MGGLARRAAYIRAFQLRSHDEAPALFVDAGNLFSDDRYAAGELPPEITVKNRWVLKGYSDFNHDAANLSYLDLPYLATLLKKDGYDKRAAEFPFIKKLISANIKPMDPGVQAPPPYVIVETTLKRGQPGKKYKIGIIGLTQGKPVSPTVDEYDVAGFHIDDPFIAAKRILPDLKKQVDFVVALAYMPQDKAQLLATQNSEIDAVIGARQMSNTGEVQHFNRATLTYAYSQTKYLGELRVYLSNDGKIENQTNRYVALDDSVPDDPAAAEVVASAHTEFTNEQSKTAQQVQASATPMTLLSTASPYAGVDECAKCHQQEYDIWKNTGHAHAMATLEKRNQQLDQGCVKCHVVGYEQGGFQAVYSTPQFANVQCESCHGPGKAHVDNPAKGYGFMSVPVGCMQCHTQNNSPDFNFALYYPKIKHTKG
jgi:2',3'-cyclic-nucleotide 2'-phosphodiesterase (5'-nucleotidase family)